MPASLGCLTNLRRSVRCGNTSALAGFDAGDGRFKGIPAVEIIASQARANQSPGGTGTPGSAGSGADMRGCFRGFFFGSIISCRACLARDAAHRHIVATNSAGPDVLCVKCCHFNGLQAYIASIRRLSGCSLEPSTATPAKSLSSLDAESRLRDSGAALASAVASSEGIRSCGNPAPVIAIMIVCYLWVIGWWLGPYGRGPASRRRPTMTGQCLLTPP